MARLTEIKISGSLHPTQDLLSDGRRGSFFPLSLNCILMFINASVANWDCGLVENTVPLWPQTAAVQIQMFLDFICKKQNFRDDSCKLWLLTGIAVVYSICILTVTHIQHIRYLHLLFLVLFCDRISLYKLDYLGTWGKSPTFTYQVLGAIIVTLPSFLMWRNHSVRTALFWCIPYFNMLDSTKVNEISFKSSCMWLCCTNYWGY